MERKRELSLFLTLNTPAFLGNAEQQAQWRTPPLKSAIRYWWRWIWMAEHKFLEDIERMRFEEGRIFGTAHGGESKNKDSRRSEIELRLSDWNVPAEKLETPQNDTALKYLGYGRTEHKVLGVTSSPREVGLKMRYPAQHESVLLNAISLMNLLGTIGGRSRNGWGSISIRPKEAPLPNVTVRRYTRPWRDAMGLNWPHAIGEDDDGHPLIWKSTSRQAGWQKSMLLLYSVRKKIFREYFNSPPPGTRIPNSVRFKVTRDSQNSNEYVAVLFHAPCKTETKCGQEYNNRGQWEALHADLDKDSRFKRFQP